MIPHLQVVLQESVSIVIGYNILIGKSQDKFTTEKGLRALVDKIDKISEGVCDGSSSGQSHSGR